MENEIRTVIHGIKDKIQSCISCHEAQCPGLKERLEHHVMSHHSSLKTFFDNTQMKPNGNNSGTVYQKNYFTPNATSNKETSTSDLTIKPKLKANNNLKNALRAAIIECIKNMPSSKNINDEHHRQNTINELTERINDLHQHGADIIISDEIEKFIENIHSNIQVQNVMPTKKLKENIENKINEIIKRFNKYKDKQDELNENDTNTTIKGGRIDTGHKKDAAIQNRQSKFVLDTINDAEESKTKLYKDNLIKAVDEQAQQTKENILQNIISNWILQINDDLNLDLTDTNIQSLTELLYNHVLPLLYRKTINRQLLKEEIVNFLYDHVDFPTMHSSKLNEFSEKLSQSLFNEKTDSDIEIQRKEKVVGFHEESHSRPLLHEIVCNNFKDVDGITNFLSLSKDITEFLLENMHLKNHELEDELFKLLKSLTDLSLVNIGYITKSIVSQIKDVISVQTSESKTIKHNKEEPGYGHTVSIFKSENDLHIRANSVSSNTIAKRMSGIIRKKPPKPKSEERLYMEKLDVIIRSWMNALPKEFKSAKRKKLKETAINNLVGDILDLVKIEQQFSKTNNDNNKYISFLIYISLNKLDIFDNIHDAEPYVEELAVKIKEIPVPIIGKCLKEIHISSEKPNLTETLMVDQINGTKRDTKEIIQVNLNTSNNFSTSLLKDLINKYLDQTLFSDNPLTREVFSQIFKNKLRKLFPILEVNMNLSQNQSTDIIKSVDKMIKELQYIHIICDWLKKFNFSHLFYTSENSHCAELIIHLAKEINDLEENIYNTFLKSADNDNLYLIIDKFVKEFPISNQHKNNTDTVEDLLKNIIASRKVLNKNNGTEKIISNSDQSISDVIEAFIHDNSQDITEDELKIEACVLRLCEEIEKLSNHNNGSFNNGISMSSDENLRRFSFEMRYAKEITDWLNNLSLKCDKNSHGNLVKMISNLAEKITEIYQTKRTDPEQKNIASELTKYLESWILALPLESNIENVLPVILQQIIYRIERVNRGKLEGLNTTQQRSSNNTKYEVNNNSSVSYEISNAINTKSDLNEVIAETVRKWCNDLPKTSVCNSTFKILKENFGSRLYDKIVELNSNPDMLKDTSKYESLLSKEIDSLLQKIPTSSLEHGALDDLKKNLLEVIMKTIKDKLRETEHKHNQFVLSKPKKTADLILEIVESWCQQLPLPPNFPEEIKDNLVIRIIMKIGELNVNPETFDDDFLYDDLLDDEIEKIISSLPTSNLLIQSKNARKYQLKEAIKAVKPIIRDEKARYEYKTELRNTVTKILKEPPHENTKNRAFLSTVTDDIADHFIIYNFNKLYQQNNSLYKNFVYYEVQKYYASVSPDGVPQHIPLIKGNEIMKELAKVPPPGENAIIKEIEEIDIKFKLIKCFDEIFQVNDIEKVTLKSQVKSILAKRLSDLNREGASVENFLKMRQETIKCLTKLDENIDLEKVESFIKEIQSSAYKNETSTINFGVQNQTSAEAQKLAENQPKVQLLENSTFNNSAEQEEWLSLLPFTSKVNTSNWHDVPEYKELSKTIEDENFYSKSGRDLDRNQTDMNYTHFEEEAPLSSSINNGRGISKTYDRGNYVKTTHSMLNTSDKAVTTAQETNTYPTHKNKLITTNPVFNHQQSEITQQSQLTETTNNNYFNKPGCSNYYHQIIPPEARDSQTTMNDLDNSVPSYRHNQYIQKQKSISPQIEAPVTHYQRKAQEIIKPDINPQIPLQLGAFIPSSMPSTSDFPRRPSNSNIRSRPSRRPSITFSDLSEKQNGKVPTHITKGCNTEYSMLAEELDPACECLKHGQRKRPSVCSVHMRRQCRICNGLNSFYCRMPPYRYPGFYYY